MTNSMTVPKIVFLEIRPTHQAYSIYLQKGIHESYSCLVDN